MRWWWSASRIVRQGAGSKSRPSPIAAWARQHDLPVETPRRLRSDEARQALDRFAPDGLLLVAYGQLVPDHLLALGERPPLNVHPSLLPRHRGAAPVASTILAGDPIGGISLMVMTPELDAGPIVAQWPVPLTVARRRRSSRRGYPSWRRTSFRQSSSAGRTARSRPSHRIRSRRP